MSDWPDYVEEIAYSMKTQKQKSSGLTPYRLVYGFEHLPIDQVSIKMLVVTYCQKLYEKIFLIS